MSIVFIKFLKFFCNYSQPNEITYNKYSKKFKKDISCFFKFRALTKFNTLINNKIIIKSKNQLWDKNEKLKEENKNLKRLNYQYENQYKSLKEKTDLIFIFS